MTKTFYITYWASKHKKHITRKGKHDEKSRYGVAKNGTPCLDVPYLDLSSCLPFLVMCFLCLEAQ